MTEKDKQSKDPAKWLTDEIAELRQEQMFSDAWAQEHLDVLGCIAKFDDPSNTLARIAAKELRNEEFNQPILPYHYGKWCKKQEARGRTPLTALELLKAKMAIFDIQRNGGKHE